MSKKWRNAVLGGVILAAVLAIGAVVVAQPGGGSTTTSPRLLHELARQVGIGALFGGDGHGGGRGFGRVNQDELARFLGVTTPQLQSELGEDGATMATVAQAHGTTRNELKAFIQTQAKTAADQAVAHGGLTQPQADRQLSMLAQRLDRMIDRTPPPAS